MKTVRVVAAVIRKDDKIFATQRGYGEFKDGWEFPGGKIEDGETPDGYTWHHDAEAGKMQLVDFETHQKTGHTGGRYIWGGGTENR